MERVKIFVTSILAEELVVEWITKAVIWIHAGLGVAVLVGGPSRFVKPSYQPLIDYTNGQTWIWGVWIIASSLLIATPFKWPNALGLWLGMIWHISWSACFTVAVINYPNAAATPMVAYAGFAAIDAALLTARVIDKKEGRVHET